MATRLSRRKIALHIAEKLLAGVSVATAMKGAAAYLVASGRTREIELLVRDIEDVLADKGVVVTDVTTAFPLTDGIRNEVRTMLGGKAQLRETIDASVLGGIKIDLPGKQYDATIQRKLTALRAKQL
jgi:F-type H+-transporting ATPase subunit delta